MDSQVDEIKNKLNVLDVVGSYIKLTKTGINHRGVCPFHQEKSPSFFVSPGRQMWHCFGCGTGGSIFDFVMKIEGVEFGDALRILAQKAGVELKRENVQLRTERQRLYEICNLACLFFEKQLDASLAGKEVQEYLQKRGLTKESIKKWRVGYSPDTWNGLTDFLIGKGYSRQEVVRAGLAIEKDQNKNDSYDRFRGRIMFPVFDLNGQPVGFGGRVFKQQNETAKYINTPQTLLYDKSGILYGLNNAKLAVRKQNHCVVTEGYTDVIMCHQAGYENTVAASGTALTVQHLGILKRYSENLVLAFDMDVAGDNATKRGINNAQELGFNIRIIGSYGHGDKKSDPADIILQNPKIWEEAVAHAKSIMDYYVDSAFAKHDAKTPEGKKQIGAIVLPAIKRLTNTIEQSHWIQVLAEKLGIKEEAITQELGKIKAEKPPQQETLPPEVVLVNSDEGQRRKLLEERVLVLVCKKPEYAKLIERLYVFSETMADALKNIKERGSTASIANTQFAKFLMEADAVTQKDSEIETELKLCLVELDKIDSKKQQQKIATEISLEKDEEKRNSLIRAFEQEAKKFHSIT